MLRSLVHFCVWEDERFWTQGNHSFDMHCSYLGPASCVSLSWVSSRCTFGGDHRSWHPVSTLSFLRATHPGGYNVMVWWLQHPLFTGNTLVLIILFSCSLTSEMRLSPTAFFWATETLSDVWLYLEVTKACQGGGWSFPLEMHERH